MICGGGELERGVEVVEGAFGCGEGGERGYYKMSKCCGRDLGDLRMALIFELLRALLASKDHPVSHHLR